MNNQPDIEGILAPILWGVIDEMTVTMPDGAVFNFGKGTVWLMPDLKKDEEMAVADIPPDKTS